MKMYIYIYETRNLEKRKAKKTIPYNLDWYVFIKYTHMINKFQFDIVYPMADWPMAIAAPPLLYTPPPHNK